MHSRPRTGGRVQPRAQHLPEPRLLDNRQVKAHLNDLCEADNVDTCVFLEPAGFAVDFQGQPHNDVTAATYLPVNEPWVSCPTKHWVTLPDPTRGRLRYTEDGHIFHGNGGAGGKGYAICLRCGRAGPEFGSDNPLRDSHPRLRGGRTPTGRSTIRRGAAEAADLSNAEQVVIACSHEASHFFIMLRYDALRRALGEDVRIRVLTYHHHVRSLPADPSADILMTWDAAGAAPQDRALAHREAVRPVCSPAYAATHAQTLAGPVAGWSGLTFLDLLRPSEGWASWEDWFAVAGRPDGAPRRLGFDSYTYVLEAAAAGHGIALGWRHFIERPLEAGALVALGDGFVEFDSAYYGVLTEKGRRKPLARRCLACFDRSR